MKRKKTKAQSKLITLEYEMLRAQKFLMNFQNGSFSYSTNLQAYRQVYKGNGVDMLLSRGRVKPLAWNLTISTQAQDLDGNRSPTPHVMAFKFSAPVSAHDAVIQANQIWLQEVKPELDALGLYVDEIKVLLKAFKNG